jgi:cation diffusion facilitator CzcD-associated flavoprotein CzcO
MKGWGVVIVGAGPYGLSAAAHLSAAEVDVKVFGLTMEFWERQMPAGMMLRSSWDACHLSDPDSRRTLDDFVADANLNLPRPVPLESFIAYGRWFQKHTVAEVDPRRIKLIEQTSKGFCLTTQDGEPVDAQCVVIATGIARYAHKPREFEALPCEFASHSSEHRDLSALRGKSVVVVGSGQSAIESAALLSENGAEVEVIMRAPAVRWLLRSAGLHRLPPGVKSLLYHHTDVGPALLSQLIARPALFRLLPHSRQNQIAYRSIRPAASAWLKPRVVGVRFTTCRKINDARRQRSKVRLLLDDGTKREADHVLLATGYQVDIERDRLLVPELLGAVSRVDGYPELERGFESSSVPGLHFLGAPAAYSFGLLLRFVSGTDYAARAITRCIAGKMPDRGKRADHGERTL